MSDVYLRESVLAFAGFYAAGLAVFAVWLWRDHQRFKSDVEDLSLTQEQLRAKYEARRGGGP